LIGRGPLTSSISFFAAPRCFAASSFIMALTDHALTADAIAHKMSRVDRVVPDYNFEFQNSRIHRLRFFCSRFLDAFTIRRWYRLQKKIQKQNTMDAPIVPRSSSLFILNSQRIGSGIEEKQCDNIVLDHRRVFIPYMILSSNHITTYSIVSLMIYLIL
jgi:hypothetical protein